MGYRPPRKIYALDFTGTDYDGLAVKMRGLTVGEELEIDTLRREDGGEHRFFELMTSLLVEWNVDDEHGQPVPATFEGVCTQDATMVGAILDALRTAVSGVPDPLPQSSPSGEPSPAALALPMEPLSPSPENSAVPA
jgi:hypothetical protein